MENQVVENKDIFASPRGRGCPSAGGGVRGAVESLARSWHSIFSGALAPTTRGLEQPMPYGTSSVPYSN